MRLLALFCLVLLAITETAKSDDSGFVSLFDGKSLQGWTRFGGKPEAWTVEKRPSGQPG